MKNIYLIILCLICFYSHSQFEASERKQRWKVVGSKKDGTVFLKLEESNLYKFSFKNYQFSENKIIQSIYLNSSDLNVTNLYSFLVKSFNLHEFENSSFKIDKFEFKASKYDEFIKVSILSNKSNKPIGWIPFSKEDVNNLFGKY